MQLGIDTKLAHTVAAAQAEKLGKAAQSLAADARAEAGEARDVPREFSRLLATMLVKEMRQALPEGFFGATPGSDVFEGWLDEHVGGAIAERDGLRLEELIAQSMRLKVEAAKREESAR
jgi:Rod binding domain-containing protein